MKPIADILEDAARLIEKPGAWVQGVSARTFSGHRTTPKSTDAACWCASGAIGRIAPDSRTNEVAHSFVHRLLRRKLWVWNDAKRRTQAEVVALLREAATLARGDTA